MACTGNTEQYCGAGNRLSVYKRDGATGPTDPTGSTTTGPSSTSVPVQQPTGAFPMAGLTKGAGLTNVGGRILSHQVPDSQSLTLELCATTCEGLGYSIAGAEYHTQCFCGNHVINGGERATNQNQCSTPCAGDSSQMCGGPDRMSLFSPNEPEVLGPPAAQTEGLNGNWEYVGCAVDNIQMARTFPWQLFFPGTLTANECLDKCPIGYMAGGLEYGEECFCGDPSDFFETGPLSVPTRSVTSSAPAIRGTSAVVVRVSRPTSGRALNPFMSSPTRRRPRRPAHTSSSLAALLSLSSPRNPSPARSPSSRSRAPARLTRLGHTSST